MTDQHAPGGSTPAQYGLPPNATELQDLIEYRKMNFALGNIFKACYRRGTCSHSDELRDMRKILWFAQREIDRLEREATQTDASLAALIRIEEEMNGPLSDTYRQKLQDDWLAGRIPLVEQPCDGCLYEALPGNEDPCSRCGRLNDGFVKDHYTPR